MKGEVIAGSVFDGLTFAPDLPGGYDGFVVLSISAQSVAALYVVRVEAPSDWFDALPDGSVLWTE